MGFFFACDSRAESCGFPCDFPVGGAGSELVVNSGCEEWNRNSGQHVCPDVPGPTDSRYGFQLVSCHRDTARSRYGQNRLLLCIVPMHRGHVDGRPCVDEAVAGVHHQRCRVRCFAGQHVQNRRGCELCSWWPETRFWPGCPLPPPPWRSAVRGYAARPVAPGCPNAWIASDRARESARPSG